MSRTNWVCLGIIVLGIMLFLYGANYYNDIVGWAGVYLFITGILVIIVLYIYSELTKKSESSEPVERAVFFLKVL
jgi:membrane-bound ClpP family serine protease